VKHSRREFLEAAAVLGVSPLLISMDPLLRLQPQTESRKVFLHGVASGDPLQDRVILWTRVSGIPASSRPGVRWEIAADQGFRRVVSRGGFTTHEARDFTVKVDAGGLRPGTTYYYRSR
jgi:alkaline phosphatase D